MHSRNRVPVHPEVLLVAAHFLDQPVAWMGRVQFFDDSIARSPTVVRKEQNSVLMSLAYRF
jgi:outer membrane scaffolding protein for murein synthesis (MipA/OmpV family)